jgi:hypothetical protein
MTTNAQGILMKESLRAVKVLDTSVALIHVLNLWDTLRSWEDLSCKRSLSSDNNLSIVFTWRGKFSGSELGMTILQSTKLFSIKLVC